jgi:dTDP-4-amino-4,6-dideoxygalactose transaminase
VSRKHDISELALCGGTPAFADTLHVGRPNLGDRTRFLTRLGEVLDRRWLTNNGPMVQEFEAAVQERLGVKHCIAMCNGTVALEIANRALGLKGEVIVPSFTFVATAHALQWQEITPVFADIDPVTHNLDPASVERMITSRTTGIVGVHLWGRPCDTDALADVARRHDLHLMYDASHAFGCSHNGRMVGNFGELEVFSFHATKFINTFEGGAVVTNDDDLAKKIRLMKNFGFSGLDNVVYLGTNGKMNEISAAMGLTLLEDMGNIVDTNERNYVAYKEGISGISGIRMFAYDDTEKNNFQYVVLEIAEAEFGLHRDLLSKVLHAENVRARQYFQPGCHRMAPYRFCCPHAGGWMLPETERLCERVLVLPTGTAVSTKDVERICNVLKLAVQQRDDILNLCAERE